jgi:choline dehydrogenase-like flavoprotein
VTQRVDVCIVGSGFGGSISAWRLAELYRANGQDASILMLERGTRKGHTDFRQSMDIDHLSDCYGLIQGEGPNASATGEGAQVVVADLVGGGSNLYLAASLRAPSEIFERRDRRPDDGPDRRMWPSQVSRASLNPYYARAEAGLRVNRPGWDQVAKSGGLWAATLDKAGNTCDRVPVAINQERCVDAKWCHTGCVFGAKNSLITNYLASAERLGVEVRPHVQVNEIRQSSLAGYRYLVKAQAIDPVSKAQSGAVTDVECKVLILAAGAMGTPPILMRTKQSGALPSLSSQLGKHLGGNGDHVAAIEYDDESKVRDLLGLPGYNDFFKGKPITTMSYDYYAGRSGHEHDGTRFTLQEIYLSQLTNFLYDDGRGSGAEPTFWGREKKRSISTWSRHIEILAMVEDTNDGYFYAVPPGGGGHIRPSPGPVGIGLFDHSFSDQSRNIRAAADEAIQDILDRAGLGRFLKLAETKGAYIAHPIGGCRMADSADLGVVDHRCEVFNYEGLFCMDSSAIPTSLGVNPSLTISAVCERAAAELVNRAADFGLPAAPGGFAPQTPAEIVGDRVAAPPNEAAPGSGSGSGGGAAPQSGTAVAVTPGRRRKRKRRHRRKHRQRASRL